MNYPKGKKRKEIKTPAEMAQANIMSMFDLKEENTELKRQVRYWQNLYVWVAVMAFTSSITVILLLLGVA